MAEAVTSLTGVLGWPVAHSRSPVMHNAAFEALGLDWRYLPLPVAPERFEETVRALEGSGYRGANITVPHKVAALGLADEATAAAAAIGAANSLSFEGGRIAADNTDAGGFLDALGEAPATALVLGAGGSARAVAWALREAGTAVAVAGRTSERVRALAGDLGVEALDRPAAADLIVNCTTVGLEPAATVPEAIEALGLGEIDPPAIAFDLVYREGATPFAAWAADGGSRVIGGLEMLVMQGARSFTAWTGEEAPVEVMREAARRGP